MTLGLTPEQLVARNRQKQKEWRAKYPDRVKAFHAKYNQKDEVKARKLEWARENKDAINARKRELYRLKANSPADASTGTLVDFLHSSEQSVDEKNILGLGNPHQHEYESR